MITYSKKLDKDFSGQTFVDKGFSGYYSNCDFSNCVFTRPIFECVFWNCNFENAIFDCPTVKRWAFFGKKTNLNGMNIIINKDCEMTSANLARCHPIIAEIMRQKSAYLPPGDRELALIASDLVKDNPDKCWKWFTERIPKRVWAHSEFGFRDKGSILNQAIRMRGKHFE